jgi:hypothetical protein
MEPLSLLLVAPPSQLFAALIGVDISMRFTLIKVERCSARLCYPYGSGRAGYYRDILQRSATVPQGEHHGEEGL